MQFAFVDAAADPAGSQKCCRNGLRYCHRHSPAPSNSGHRARSPGGLSPGTSSPCSSSRPPVPFLMRRGRPSPHSCAAHIPRPGPAAPALVPHTHPCVSHSCAPRPALRASPLLVPARSRLPPILVSARPRLEQRYVSCCIKKGTNK